MIIVSQDRMSVVNFDNVTAIYIRKNYIMRDHYPVETYGIICDTNNGGDYIILGEYDTKEECQNVFNKIIHDLNANFIINKNHIIYGELNED